MHVLQVEHPVGKIISVGTTVVGVIRCSSGRLVLASPELDESLEDLQRFVAAGASSVKSRKVHGKLGKNGQS